MNILTLAAVVLFILAAVFFFMIPDIELRDVLGVVAAGLACFAASGLAPWRIGGAE